MSFLAWRNKNYPGYSKFWNNPFITTSRIKNHIRIGYLHKVKGISLLDAYERVLKVNVKDALLREAEA